MFLTREVWKTNVDEELRIVKDCVKNFSKIAIDTEFPGFIHWTKKDDSEDKRYKAMKKNVEGTKLIQFGFTLFNDQGMIGGSWEVNFSNFGESSDARNERSIKFLEQCGLNFKKIREDGIDMFEFFPKFLSMLGSEDSIQWVTFHGDYDLAYIISIISKLPETSHEFVDTIGWIFGVVYDVKAIASADESLGDLGLEKLAHKLHIQRIGHAHHAGSDSSLIAFTFTKIKQLGINIERAIGILYGMSRKVVSTRLMVNTHAMILHNSSLVPYPSPQYYRYSNYGPYIFYNYPLFGSSAIYNNVFYMF